MPLFDAHAYFGATPFSSATASRDAVRQTMARYGVNGTALVSNLAAHCDFVAGNRRLVETLDPGAGLFGYVTLSPDYTAESLEEQRKYLTRRDVLGGALFGHDGHPVTVDHARDILNAHRRYTKPMAIHVPDAAAVHAARQIAAEFPSMKLVFLGMGGEDWHTAVVTAKQYLNVYLEVSGSLDADKLSHAAATLTPRKLLFGSGLPDSDPHLILGLIAEARGVTDYDRARILSQNAQGLFNLSTDLNAQPDAA